MLEIITGPMWAGKSARLIERVREWYEETGRMPNVVVPRYRDGVRVVESRSGAWLPACAVSVDDIWHSIAASRWVAIDESQFFPADKLIELTQAYAGRLTDHLILSGLEIDSEGKPFGGLQACIPLADRVTRLTAECACGSPATMTICTGEKDGQVAIGDHLYRPGCVDCWAEAMGGAE